jgi:hypothetical protein
MIMISVVVSTELPSRLHVRCAVRPLSIHAVIPAWNTILRTYVTLG